MIKKNILIKKYYDKKEFSNRNLNKFFFLKYYLKVSKKISIDKSVLI